MNRKTHSFLWVVAGIFPLLTTYIISTFIASKLQIHSYVLIAIIFIILLLNFLGVHWVIAQFSGAFMEARGKKETPEED